MTNVLEKPDAPTRPVRFIRSMSGASLAAGAVAFLLALTGGRAEAFVYDAATYWSGAGALASGGDYFTAGFMNMRGALASVPYIPAAVLADLAGTGGRGLVLMENALLIAVIGAVIIPAILRHLVMVTRLHVWVSAVLTAGLLAGFASYPLMDLWAIGFALGGLALILKRRWWLSIGAGVAFGVAVNLRPAYLVPLVIGFLVWACFQWRKAHWPLVGAFVTTLPQMLVNARHSGSWSPSPLGAGAIMDIQTQFASFVTRYDTVAFVGAANPRQFYCSPDAAATVVDGAPTSLGQLALHFLDTLSTSLVFLAQKAGASLMWDSHTPYAAAPSQMVGPLTVLVMLVSAGGLLALVKLWVERKAETAKIAVVLAVWFGSLLTVLGSTPETRFALPLVLLGVLGCLAVLPTGRLWRPRPPVVLGWTLGTIFLVGALLALGLVGTSKPAAPGMADVAMCAEL